MSRPPPRRRGRRAAILLAAGALVARGIAAEPSFEAEIRPLLEARCFECHGRGQRKGGLDLRQRHSTIAGGKSGTAVAPGRPEESLLLRRVTVGEMPPGDRAKLGVAEIALLRRWIESGASGGAETAALPDASAVPEGWVFRPPARAALPSVDSDLRARTPVDAFLGAPLARSELRFSVEAPRHTLIRRAAFDLLGLPPSPDETSDFADDTSPDAFERLLDRLLASPRHGERWGRHWLDAAGYADSEGYNDADLPRPDAWKYRDYVIDCFNEGRPFDVFLTEQLAGDELAGYPGCELNADNVRLITATGFLRMAADGTGDGAGDAKLARNQVVADTLRIFGTALLGMTLGCAQCHDHRYDPITQVDYYRLRAVFEPALDVSSWKPPAARRVPISSEADRRRAAEIDAAVAARRAERQAKEAAFVRAVVGRLLEERLPAPERDAVRRAVETPEAQRSGADTQLLSRYPFLNVSGGTLYQYDEKAVEELKRIDAEIAALAAARPREEFLRALGEEPGRVPATRLLVRGDPDQPSEEVQPGVPAVLTTGSGSADLDRVSPAHPGRPERTSGRRLRLARWLVSRDQPLTARVLANRVWMHHFGRGIVASAGDFGSQGEAPTHPELLDYLAIELTGSGWDLKRLHRLIMASAGYRQSSTLPAAPPDADPDGSAMYWRKPLQRLEGEAVRDALLASTGLLSQKAGGAPVPVREDAAGSIVVGIDRKAESNRPGTEVPLGEDEFRRSVYIEVRRSRPLSFTGAFDVPVMESNCAERPVSIVPQQALTLLNGGFARRAAELFARRVEAEAGDGDEARVRAAFAIAFSRPPDAGEVAEAIGFLTGPAGAGAAQTAAVRHAVLADFCQTLVNTGEFITLD